MRTRLLALVLPSLLSCGFCFAQAAAPGDDSQPASSNVPGAEYPRIHSDLRVTFRLKAPEAQKVRLHLDKDYDLQRDSSGVWSVSTTPQVPGFHYYWFILDGVNVCDPASETFYGVSRQYSGIEVPEKGVDFYYPKDVPHGEIRERWYFSKTTAAWRRIFVYTPPDYDSNRDARYPVLYLQHGGGEDERGWVVQGRVNHIMDNLIAAKKAKPMIIVMEKGYARRAGEPEMPLRPPAAGTGAQRPDFSRLFGTREEVFIKDLIPMIDATYRTKADREHRALAGLSMGGGQSLNFGLGHLETFAWVGAFSPAPNTKPAAQLVPDPAAATQKLKLLWLSCGNKDGLIRISQGVHTYLKENRIPHIWHVDGNAHDTPEWRNNLYLFSQRIFR